mmetsp:Transcript_24472/g.97085  ORF Transcript_24472/g.97085 Transcript_24472/m.97085 type:complete len:95 (+) Transcript_24472:1261-1545(+)
MRGGRRFRSRAAFDAATFCDACGDADARHDADLLLCDLCDRAVHRFCLDPPLAQLPDAEWLCPDCDAAWTATTAALTAQHRRRAPRHGAGAGRS